MTRKMSACEEKRWQVVVVAKVKNASHGYGRSPVIAKTLQSAGVNVSTLGNHAWDRRDMLGYSNQAPISSGLPIILSERRGRGAISLKSAVGAGLSSSM